MEEAEAEDDREELLRVEWVLEGLCRGEKRSEGSEEVDVAVLDGAPVWRVVGTGCVGMACVGGVKWRRTACTAGSVATSMGFWPCSFRRSRSEP